MSARDNLPKTSFGAITFPAERINLRVLGAHFEHQYPHVPKSKYEKLGARSRRVTLRGSFQDRFAAYPGLYPAGMLQMLAYAETMSTQTLVHFSAGPFPAFIVNWDQMWEAKLRSGEKVDIEFVEDSSNFTSTFIASPSPNASLAPSAAQLAADLASVKSQLSLTSNDLSLFDALQAAAQTVSAARDTATLYNSRLASAVTQVINLCQQLHDVTASLQDVRAWPVVSDILAVWAIAVGIQQDLAAQQVKLLIYNVPFTQPVAQIARTLYGDVSRQSDLLALNSDVIIDPMRVRATTPIRYYPP